MTCSAQRGTIRLLAWMIAWFLGLATPAILQAQSFTVLHSFSDHADGAYPKAGVVLDRADNLYGTTSPQDGTSPSSAFELKAAGSGWVLKPLFDFPYNGRGSYGYALATKPVFGPDGALYAAAQQGGDDNCFPGTVDCGTVIKLQPPSTFCPSFFCRWDISVLYYFFGTPDGSYPDQIVFGPDGNIYGTTLYGGTGQGCSPDGCGTVYKLANSGGEWTKTTIFNFDVTNGDYPSGGIIFDAAGNAYGFAEGGGSNNFGIVYELTPVVNGFWTQTILYTFQGGSDGEYPEGPPIMDAAGNLYGVTGIGGSGTGGTVFELSQPGTWNFQTLYSFPSEFHFEGPGGGLLLDGSGNLYGTTRGGGVNSAGTAFKLAPAEGSWSYTDLHDFSVSDGQQPNGELIFDANGNIYGTSVYGGALGYGTVWKLTP